MKSSKKFSVATPIFKNGIGTAIVGCASIKGIGYWNSAYQSDWDNQNCELEDIASFDVEQVILQMHGEEQDSTMAYRMTKALYGDLADQIDNAVLAHMEYLFGNETSAPAEADRIEDLDYDYEIVPEKKYEVIAIAGTSQQLLGKVG